VRATSRRAAIGRSQAGDVLARPRHSWYAPEPRHPQKGAPLVRPLWEDRKHDIGATRDREAHAQSARVAEASEESSVFVNSTHAERLAKRSAAQGVLLLDSDGARGEFGCTDRRRAAGRARGR
jgi:hypothetical protein